MIEPDTPEEESDAMMDRLNAHIKARHVGADLEAVLGEYRRSFQDLITEVQAMSDADLNDTTRFVWLGGDPLWVSIAGNRYEHVDEHTELTRDWLRSHAG